MAQAAEEALRALDALAVRGSSQVPSLQVACGLARQCIRSRCGFMLQTGVSPRALETAAKVDHALRNDVFRWLQNPAE
eukprot:10167798-Alexandrium_andersonii.AAC.1